MNESFDGKVALVTGAGSGMGLATAKAFAEAGARVVLADIHEEAVRAAAEQLNAGGHKALAVRCDVTDEAQVASMIERTVSTFGRLDAAFNNAGVISRPTETIDISDDEWERVMAINLRGVWYCMKYELRQMLRQGSGAIVNCSSMGGLAGTPGLSAYAASKHGVIGLTKSAALEYAARGIRVNAVCPGMINTPMAQVLSGGDASFLAALVKEEPIGRFGEPQEKPMSTIPSVTLNNGITMPHIGLGVLFQPNDQTVQSVSAAFEAGYRLIGTASKYENEEGVGEAVRNSGLPREEIFCYQ